MITSSEVLPSDNVIIDNLNNLYFLKFSTGISITFINDF